MASSRRRLAIQLLIWLVVSFLLGCGRSAPVVVLSTTEFDALLLEGNRYCEESHAAALRRDYPKLTESYEQLRKSYIQTAEQMVGHAPYATSQTLDELAHWEAVIADFRKFWKESDQLPAQSLNEMPSREKQVVVSESMKKLLEESMAASKAFRRAKNAEWAPIEKQLDQSLARVRKLRSK
jgi:hypothetical protein